MAHCLLNQNTRYLGGAACAGVVRAAVDGPLGTGAGIVQLPCPEQRVWGGVVKRRFLWLLEHRLAARAGRLGWPVLEGYLRRRYAVLARRVVHEVADYTAHGFRVSEIVGVGGSPSCGVTTTLDLPAALRTLARDRRAPVTSRWLNDRVVAANTCAGQGLFVAALADRLRRDGLPVPLREVVLDPAPTRDADDARSP